MEYTKEQLIKKEIDRTMNKYNIEYQTERRQTRLGWCVIIPLKEDKYHMIHIEHIEDIQLLKEYLDKNHPK